MNRARLPGTRYRFVIKNVPDNPDLWNELATQSAEASGIHRNSFKRAFMGEQIGEPTMAAWAALHPDLPLDALFTLLPPGPYTVESFLDAETAAKGKDVPLSKQALWTGWPDIPVSYQDALDRGIKPTELPTLVNDTQVCIISWALPVAYQFNGDKIPAKSKGDVVPVIAWHRSGEISVFPWIIVPAIRAAFTPALSAAGVDVAKIRWVPGSEPSPHTGRLLKARHYYEQPATQTATQTAT